MDQKETLYLSDKVLAAVQTGCFLLAVLVTYFTAWRLFDQRLATYASITLLICERFWDFSMSGLPQMLMLLLFSGATYCVVRAVEARTAGKSTLWWAIATGVLFGLLALTHALTLWIFVGLLFFSIFYFLPRGRDAAIMFGIVALMYAPWMIRNDKVCGNPLGLGWYSGLFQIQGSEGKVMRSMELKLDEVTPTVFRVKLQGQILEQLGGLYQYFGYVLVAPIFFIALLHLFRRRETATFRWCILSMWLFAVFGMAAFGLNNEVVGGGAASTLHSNDLHILFVPLLTCYGFAFLLMMWSRLEINMRLARIAFMSVIFFLTAMPFLQQLIELEKPAAGRVQWPPYVPPIICALSKWTLPNEIIASDMPWAVAWYADRKSLWLPMTVADFISLSDNESLGSHLVGLYLTPVTGNRPFISEVVKGEYKEWAPFIVRQVNIRDFPLRAVVAMPIDNECVFYADRDRWSARED